MLVTNLSIHVKLEKFEKWCNLQQKGKGVILYKEFPPANQWLRNREGLTLSECLKNGGVCCGGPSRAG